MSRNPHNRAFTLVELLVVIGIIALLISFLMPALSRVRDSAKAVQCASNLRQLHMGVLMYAGESKGFYPAAWHPDNLTVWAGTPSKMLCWSRWIFPYVNRNRSVFICPAQKASTAPWASIPYPTFWRDYEAGRVYAGVGGDSIQACTYGYNAYLHDGAAPRRMPGYRGPLRLGTVRKSAICPMISDCFMVATPVDTGNPDVGPWGDEVNSWWYNAPAPRHGRTAAGNKGGKANIVFVDGHVAAVPADWNDLPQPPPKFPNLVGPTAYQGIDFLP